MPFKANVMVLFWLGIANWSVDVKCVDGAWAYAVALDSIRTMKIAKSAVALAAFMLIFKLTGYYVW